MLLSKELYLLSVQTQHFFEIVAAPVVSYCDELSIFRDVGLDIVPRKILEATVQEVFELRMLRIAAEPCDIDIAVVLTLEKVFQEAVIDGFLIDERVVPVGISKAAGIEVRLGAARLLSFPFIFPFVPYSLVLYSLSGP